MAKEQLLVCDALDERDFLRKKIMKAINEASFICAKKARDEKVEGADVETFKKNAQATYQSIQDMIKRYNAIDTAITQSNAETQIETRSGVKMTRAAAIAQRKVLLSEGRAETDFTGALLRVMKQQYSSATMRLNELNTMADHQAESLKLNMVGKDTNKKLTDEDVKVVEAMVTPLYGELVDPIGLKDEYNKALDKYNTLVKEIETAIKVSNATTYIEFEY